MTEKDKQSSFVYSNVRAYFEIAQESFRSMNSLMQNGRKPKPNNESGWINTYDPDHKSFKKALVTIIFSGVYLEALLHILIVEKEGLEKFNQYDRKTYEDKLQLLACNDEAIIAECEHYRTVRREIAHEKAHLDAKVIKMAQEEATRAFNMVESINAHFVINMR